MINTKHIKKTLTFLLILASILTTFAQNYPVQVTTFMQPPYSSNLSDYANSNGQQRLSVQIFPSDLSILNRRVYLKMYLESYRIKAMSIPVVPSMPIHITGGMTIRLTNLDIANYFKLENIIGLSPQQYAQPLPEGMYTLCFEVYDAVTNLKLSQKSCTSFYLMLNQPPLLNIPTKNETIAASDFPNIMFTWTPRSANATNVSYVFELKEILDKSLDPQIAFMMSPMLHKESLYSTALLYNLSKPNLIPGKTYAWRVRAISTSGFSENAVFKNDGYSDIYHFKYATNCSASLYALSEIQSTQKTKISWQSNPKHLKYHIQYRKKDVKKAYWFDLYTQNTSTLLYPLEAGVAYEYRVGATCENLLPDQQEYTYTPINYFTMPTLNESLPMANCGISPQIKITNKKPITNLTISETFTAGDFPVKILQLQQQGKTYSGTGYIIVPYLGDTKIAVVFNNITINTDYQLIKGFVTTTYEPTGGNIENLQPVIDDIKDIVKGISDLFNKAATLEKQKEEGTISETDYNASWNALFTEIQQANNQYKELTKSADIPDNLKKELADLDPVFIDLASNNFTTKGNQTSENIHKVKTVYEKVEAALSEKCEEDLNAIATYLSTESVNYLKLLASELGQNETIQANNKTYTTSSYNEDDLSITHYKNWSTANPAQHLFLIKTKTTNRPFWISYIPNSINGTESTIATKIYLKDTQPLENEPDYCIRTINIPKGITAGAALSEAIGQATFYAALGLSSAQIYTGIKTAQCISGFSMDIGLQLGILAIMEKFQNPNNTIDTKKIIKDVSLPSAITSCATGALINQCGAKCAGLLGTIVGVSDDIINQLKEGKKITEIDVQQTITTGIIQGIAAAGTQQLLSFATTKWKGKYSQKQIAEAFEDLEKNPGKYFGEGNLASKLTGSLKATYDDLVKNGIRALEEGNSIRLLDKNNIEIAIINDGVLTPKKWISTYQTEILSKTESGYWLIKEKDSYGLGLGYKNGREFDAEFVNAYHTSIGNHPPYKQLTKVFERDLQIGDKIYIVEYKVVDDITKPNPGGWGSKNKITTVKELREELAILNEWKNLDEGELVLREYTVIKPLPVRDGVIGPLQETGNINTQVYQGGQHQYEFIEDLRGEQWEKYLKITDRIGTILK